jgi:hypothetical protein
MNLHEIVPAISISEVGPRVTQMIDPDIPFGAQ